ncbi:hypothetical protein J2W33_003357 [Variovorax boronicumulans]|nr:hypothetical protein [Variovorax boronicumulans]
MAVIAEDLRMAALQGLGLSEPLMRLAAGECIHDAFRGRCLGPPFHVYHRAGVPTGPPLIPLWDSGDIVFGVWEKADALEFIEFSIETPEEFELVAKTEQGFWAARFDFLYECDLPDEDLQSAAASVGFRFLTRQLASREEAGERLDTFQGHRAWLRELVAEIDRDVRQHQENPFGFRRALHPSALS